MPFCSRRTAPHEPPAVANRKRAAFTLVELLVVVGIVFLLIAILLPAFGRARGQANSVVCQSNLRQLGMAFQAYTQQHGGKTFSRAEGGSWVVMLENYVAGLDRVMLCPEAQESTGVPQQYLTGGWCFGTSRHRWAWKVAVGFPDDAVSWGARGGGYGYNTWLFRVNTTSDIPPWTPREAYVTLPAKNSSRVPVFGDAVIYEGTPKHTDPPPTSLMTPVPSRGGGDPNMGSLGMRQFCVARHGRAVNLAFLDGHVEWVQLEGLWKLPWNREFVPTDVTLPPE